MNVVGNIAVVVEINKRMMTDGVVKHESRSYQQKAEN
jgi:hypothetical protein